MKRRTFIKNTGFYSLGVTCGFVSLNFLESCSTSKKIKGTLEKNILKVNLSELIGLSFARLTNPHMDLELGLVLINNEWIALNLACTHQGCITQKVGARFNCPCHGAEFNLQGLVLNGPTKKNLQRFKTEINNEFLNINLS